MAAEFDSPSDSVKVIGIALEFPACESTSPTKVPRRIRQRLLESSPPPCASTHEEIEAKLREADLRRQQFHEWLSNKARPKPRSPSWSSQDEDLAQRLDAKLYAAEQKRMNILAKDQMRLARLDELRQAAKNGVELRYEKEREELGTKVESRVQQAELNRMLIRKAYKQRRAAAQERTAQSLLQRRLRENKHKELVHMAMCQKRAAAEKKRLGLLEAEKTRAHAKVMQARRVAKTVCHQREIERRRLKDQLEDRLQRARRQRAEYLRHRGNSYSSSRINWHKMHKHGDFLSRKLASCWRRFLRSRRTTLALAKAFDDLSINEKSVRSMPFEQLAVVIESASTLQTVRALLDRLESRFMLSQANLSTSSNIEHLLKRLTSPKRRGGYNSCSKNKGARKGSNKETKSREVSKLLRYPTRVVLCAYMILGHPEAVFSGRGEREVSLAEAAVNFIQEFEMLVKIIIDGPSQISSAGSSRQSSPDIMSSNSDQEEPSQSPTRRTFRSQLVTFDAAWCSYLYRFVVWKVKDAQSLEEDLVRAACQLELSMMQTCKLTAEGDSGFLTYDMKAIQKQVSEDQNLLREKVQHLSGSAGVERMDYALSDTRSKYFEAKENGSPSISPVAHISSSTPGSSSETSLPDLDQRSTVVGSESSNHIVRLLFRDVPSSSKVVAPRNLDAQMSSSKSEKLVTENEAMVNEILHVGPRAFADSFDVSSEDHFGIKAKIKETMEKAFWDEIVKSMKKDDPDYGQVILLVKEVRDELHEMAPQSWKQEINEVIDIDILSQVLKSGVVDMGYLGRILEFSLAMLLKLSAPAKEEEMKKTHNNLLNELAEMACSDGGSNNSFVIATIRGLRFVLEQIQELKREISKARIWVMEPFVRGPAGFEYLQKAFTARHGHPSYSVSSLPLTAQWLSSVGGNAELEWEEHKDSLSALRISNASSTQGHPLPNSLRTGGSVPLAGSQRIMFSNTHISSTARQLPECSGERVDMIVRLGLLKLVSCIEGITKEELPETLQLNFSRLRAVQSQLQKIIVISTSILVLRQILLSENPATADMETIISDYARRLSNLLDHNEDAGITEIVETTTGASEEENASSTEKLQTRKKVMASMLVKSLQAGDPVFAKVSQAVYLAARGVVVGGNTSSGRKLVEASLRRIGCAVLTDLVVQAAEVLVVVAMVTGHVHGPWYSVLVENM